MQVSYGSVSFQLVKTGEVVREPQLSADGTELLFMRSRYTFAMIYSPGSTSFAGAGGSFEQDPTAGPGATDVAIRYYLMAPRRKLVIVDEGGDTILSVPGVGYDRDPDNGPTPLSCSVVGIAPRTWRVVWSVSVAEVGCGYGAGDFTNSVPPILSNRYSQAQQTGPDRLTTVVTKGLTIFNAAALVALQTTADYYRSRCIPGLAKGFRRQSINVDVNSAGTALSWTVVDTEAMVSINNSKGVEGFEASFSMSSMGPEGGGAPTGWTMARFDGFAWGNKTSSRQGMFGWLASLAIERMNLPNGPVQVDQQPQIMRVTASEKIDKPFVELHIDVKLPPAKDPKKGFGALRTDFLGVDVINLFSNDGLNPQMPGDSNTRGTANVLNLVAAIKEACGGVPDLPTTSYKSGGSPGDNYTASQTATTVQVVDGLPSLSTRYSQSAVSQGTYTEMSIQSTWKTDQGKYPARIAGKSPNEEGYVSGGGTGTGTSGGSSGSSTAVKPSVTLITLCRPTTELTVTFEAERHNAPPTIPDANTKATNLVLLEETLSPIAVGLAGDGITPVFRIGGVYRYAAKKPRNPSSSIYFGVHPFTDFVFGDTLAGVGSGSSDPDGSAAGNANFYAHGLFDPPGDDSKDNDGENDDPDDPGDLEDDEEEVGVDE